MMTAPACPRCSQRGTANRPPVNEKKVPPANFMDSPNNPPERIQTSGAGSGEISREQIEDRAAELARMEARDAVNEGDLAQAEEDLEGPGTPPPAPELVQPELGDVVAWDEPVDASGQRAPRTGLEDETMVGQRLVEEGIEEADHDRRVAASEEIPDEELS